MDSTGAFDDRRTEYFDTAFPGLNDLLLDNKINSRTILEELPPNDQCIFTIGDLDQNADCWLCGLQLGSDTECEHVLPILTAYLVFGGLAQSEGTEEEYDIKKMEYRWAHRVCNRTKTDNIFMDDDRVNEDNIRDFLTRLAAKQGPYKNALDAARTEGGKNIIRINAYNSIISVITPIIAYWNHQTELNLLAGVAAVQYKLKEIAARGKRAGLVIKRYLDDKETAERNIRGQFKFAQLLATTTSPITREYLEIGYISDWIRAYPTSFVSRTNELRINTSEKESVKKFTTNLFSNQTYMDYLATTAQNIPQILNFVRGAFLDRSGQHYNLGKFTLFLDTLFLFNAKRTTNDQAILLILNKLIDNNRTISPPTENISLITDQQCLSWFDEAVVFMLNKTPPSTSSLMAGTMFARVQISPQTYKQLSDIWIGRGTSAVKTGGRSDRAYKTRRVKRKRRKTKRAVYSKNK